MVQAVLHITEIPQFLVDQVIDVLVVQVVRVPRVPSWRRQSCSTVAPVVNLVACSSSLR